MVVVVRSACDSVDVGCGQSGGCELVLSARDSSSSSSAGCGHDVRAAHTNPAAVTRSALSHRTKEELIFTRAGKCSGVSAMCEWRRMGIAQKLQSAWPEGRLG